MHYSGHFSIGKLFEPLTWSTSDAKSETAASRVEEQIKETPI